MALAFFHELQLRGILQMPAQSTPFSSHFPPSVMVNILEFQSQISVSTQISGAKLWFQISILGFRVFFTTMGSTHDFKNSMRNFWINFQLQILNKKFNCKF